ncbi:MAG TPA: hypothetical protein VG167_03535 [Verrucomicrobiae bacterium]|nr:hypothetical protein [Verrucomicrobiae bacterium]
MRIISLAIGMLVSLSAAAQNYSIDWFKVAGGSGVSTGGVYTVSGTMGQHDAGPAMGGGGYSLTGGFWALLAIQATGAPTLSISLTSTNTAVVSWPAPSAGWQLQQTPDLRGGSWSTPSESVQDNGTIRFILVNSPVGNRFYRLSHR